MLTTYEENMSIPVNQPHRNRMNQGAQLTPRIEALLRITGQQGILRFDQVQRWLAHLSPEPDKMKQADRLSAERTRKILRPWFDQQVFSYKVFYAHQKGVLWLTPKGLKYADLNLRYYEPTPASLPHLCAVNDIRLLIAARRPGDTWRSERELRAEQNARPKGSIIKHLPDAELISPNGKTITAIEVELTIKAEKRLQDILYDLAANQRFTKIWYFANEQVYPALAAALGKLPSEHRSRFVVYTLEGKVYTS